MMRDALGKLTAVDVNRAIRQHFTARDLSVVIITKDAAGLKSALIADGFSPVKYDAAPSNELSAEDQVIGNFKLGIRPEAVTIIPADKVFAD